MLSIGTFSQLKGLPAGTLRYYHAEGLLVPAEVDRYSQFRRYTVEQVVRAGQVAALRRAGLPVSQIRRLLEDVDLASQALQEHQESLRRQRLQQDQAINEATEALNRDLKVQTRSAAAAVALTTCTSVRNAKIDKLDVVRADVDAAITRLTEVAEGCGWRAVARPWTTMLPLQGDSVPLQVNVAVDGNYDYDYDDPRALPDGVVFTEWTAGDRAVREAAETRNPRHDDARLRHNVYRSG